MNNVICRLLAVVSGIWTRIEGGVLDRLAPLADLAARLYVANVFFSSGWNKSQDWTTTLYLFREEYNVPLLPPDVAALLGAGGELGFSALLAIGLFTRFSALGLSVVNGMAVMSYYSALKDSPAALQDHLTWGLMLALLVTARAGVLTLDRLMHKIDGCSSRNYADR